MIKPIFKRIKAVTLPLFKWVNGKECFYRFEGKTFVGKEVKSAGGKPMEPATLANVTNLETGEEGQIILGTVLKKILDEEYPHDAYVHRCFAITQNRIETKGYNTYTLIEIEVENAEIETRDGPNESDIHETAESEHGGHPHDDDVKMEDTAPHDPVTQEELDSIPEHARGPKHPGKKK